MRNPATLELFGGTLQVFAQVVLGQEPAVPSPGSRERCDSAIGRGAEPLRGVETSMKGGDTKGVHPFTFVHYPGSSRSGTAPPFPCIPHPLE